MKKLMLIVCLLIATLTAQAQFEQGKWIVNPSVTGMNLSHSKAEDTTFGFMAQAGNFLLDNVALMVTMGAEWTDLVDSYTLGTGGRYYFDQSGIYTGLGIAMNKLDIDSWGKETFWSLNAEVGYAFFITKTVTIEPAAYCNISMKDSDYTKYGFKVGFGIYF